MSEYIFHLPVVLVSKNLSERRSTKSDMSPVSLRSALPSAKTQNRVSQVLQVQVPLNPLRKKSTAKDIGTPSQYICTKLSVAIIVHHFIFSHLLEAPWLHFLVRYYCGVTNVSPCLQTPTLPRWLRNLQWTHQKNGAPRDPLMTRSPPSLPFTPAPLCHRMVLHEKVRFRSSAFQPVCFYPGEVTRGEEMRCRETVNSKSISETLMIILLSCSEVIGQNFSCTQSLSICVTSFLKHCLVSLN